MNDEKKDRINKWLELARLIIAVIAGLLGGGGAQVLL